MTITPFPARTPQILAAAASFKIVIDSISFGFNDFKSPTYGKLSTTIKASLLASMVLKPRITIPTSLPRPDVIGWFIKPLVTFKILSNTFVPTERLNSSLSICTKLPVALSFGIF
ncbi:hypothetical protein D3C87_1523030 [compost metagenome]